MARLPQGWRVLESRENAEHDRCVDIFSRADGSYGFEEFRRDPEDAGAWTAVGGFSALRQATHAQALSEAARRVAWVLL